MSADNNRRTDLLLPGLDGANPLAFLAALGAMRTLTLGQPEWRPRMYWKPHRGRWCPGLLLEATFPEGAAPDTVADALMQHADKPEQMWTSDLADAAVKTNSKWENTLKFPARGYREFCLAARRQSERCDRTMADYAAAWGTDAVVQNDGKLQRVQRTFLDFTAGNQKFRSMIAKVVASCTAADLLHTLFTGMNYQAGTTSMRWDPLDEKRQYALQAIDPTQTAKSKNPILADLGANRLAICAVPLIPLIPQLRRAVQPGRTGARQRAWRWPVWTRPANLYVLRSLLAMEEIMTDPVPHGSLAARGIVQVYESNITMPTNLYYRCFSPARAV